MNRILQILILVCFMATSAYAESWKSQKPEDTNVGGGEIIYVESETGTTNNWMSLNTLKTWMATTFASKTNVLQLDNISAFTPDADYEPATKKYVDDNAGDGVAPLSTVRTTAAGGSTTAPSQEAAVGDALAGKVATTGNETIAGVKTFSSSPILPTPTTDMQGATKKYVDDNAGVLPSGTDGQIIEYVDTTPTAVTPTTITPIAPILFDGATNEISLADTVPRKVEMDSQAEFEALFFTLPTGTFAFDTYPEYEDSAHNSGLAVNATTLAVYSTAASKWMTVDLTDSLDPTPTTYSMNLTLAGVTGLDKVTVVSTDYTSSDIITGLSSATTALTGVPAAGRQVACTGTAVTGTTPDYLVDMSDSNEDVACTFSPSVTIYDDFSSDTIANYTAIAGSMTISGEKLHGQAYASSVLYHETTTGSNDHYVQGKLLKVSGDESGLVLRCNGTTGYYIFIDSLTVVKLNSFNGATPAYVGAWTVPTLTDGQEILIKVSVSGNVFSLFLDYNGDGDFDDTNEVETTLTSSTYTTGEYIGPYISRGAADAVTVDNLSGDAL